MKTPKIIVSLLILLTVSAYATHGPVKGYTSDNCQDEYREFDSYTDLVLAHGKEDKNNNNEVWNCGSYMFDNDREEECHIYEDIPTIRVVGTPLPDWDSDVDHGDAGSASTIDVEADYGNDNPGKDFDQEDVDEIVECLLDAAASNARIADWVGGRTEATWLDETNEYWYATDDKWDDHNIYGLTEYRGENTENFTTHVYMDGKKMGNAAQRDTLPFKHVLIYWHLHEYVHVLQAEQERNDEDDRYTPSMNWVTRWDRELEAIETVDEWWRALFGDDFDPPYLIPPHLLNYDEVYDRREELLDKKADGTLSRAEKKELKKLNEWFNEVQRQLPKAEPNKTYKKKKLNHCA